MSHAVIIETPDTVAVRAVCTDCHRAKLLIIPGREWKSWKDGALIQNAIPSLSADGRELLITGLCGKCFDALWMEEA